MNAGSFKMRFLGLAIGCLLLAGRAAAQTDILITYYTGTEQGYTVAESGKLYFENGNLLVKVSSTATATTIPVSIIRKITFASAPLPLQLLDFSLVNEKTQISLSWKTSSELNTSHFIIERSTDATNYSSLGQVTATRSSGISTYHFTDLFPQTGTSYYRLKQVDTDGKFVYSNLLTVKRSTSNVVVLLPNPAHDYFTISSGSTESLQVKIYSAEGKLMLAGTYAPGANIAVGNLPGGMYIAYINNTPYKLIKQ